MNATMKLMVAPLGLALIPPAPAHQCWCHRLTSPQRFVAPQSSPFGSAVPSKKIYRRPAAGLAFTAQRARAASRRQKRKAWKRGASRSVKSTQETGAHLPCLPQHKQITLQIYKTRRRFGIQSFCTTLKFCTCEDREKQ